MGLTDVGVAGATRRFRGRCLPTTVSLENETDGLKLVGCSPSLSTQMRNEAGDGDYGAGTSKASENGKGKRLYRKLFCIEPD